MELKKKINKARSFICDKVDDIIYGTNNIYKKLSFPIRDHFYKKTNGYSREEVFLCGDYILDKAIEFSNKYFPEDYKNVFEAFRCATRTDIYLLLDRDIWKELRFYKKIKNAFADSWYELASISAEIEDFDEFYELLEYVSGLLIAYRYDHISYPGLYVKEHTHLIEDIEKFKDEKVDFLFYKDEERKNQDGSTKTNEELGLDLALFNEDMKKCYWSIKNYLEWNQKVDGISPKEAFKFMDASEYEQIDTLIRTEMLLAWNWLGNNIIDVSD